jgi:toxin ParE1/3/4
MLPVVWLDEAKEDARNIVRFIAIEGQSPSAARRLKDRLDAAPLPLSEHPYLHPVGRVPGTRELVAHPNYVIVYRVTATHIEIINVLHARQQYP